MNNYYEMVFSKKGDVSANFFLPQTGSIQADEALPVLLSTVPRPYRGRHPPNSTQVPPLRCRTCHRRHLHGLPTAHGPRTGPAGNWVYRRNLHGLPTAHRPGTGPAGNWVCIDRTCMDCHQHMDQKQVQQVTGSRDRTCMDCQQHLDQEQVQQVTGFIDRTCMDCQQHMGQEQVQQVTGSIDRTSMDCQQHMD